MINYIVYTIILIILFFVSAIVVKAINRGIEAKQNLNKDYKLENKKIIMKKIKYSMANETNDFFLIHSERIISNKWFKKAK
tara:strand:- start:576 stop:818 length:243 start_codon:yes stop_codon:yes gene_type:complete